MDFPSNIDQYQPNILQFLSQIYDLSSLQWNPFEEMY